MNRNINKILFIVSAFLLFLWGCKKDKDASSEYILPAEWEPQNAVYVSFFGGPMDEVIFQVVKEISQTTPVRCIVPRRDLLGNPTRDAMYAFNARLESMGANLNNIEVLQAENLVQVRDVGPIFVKNRTGGLSVVDFSWNDYGDTATLVSNYGDNVYFDSLIAASQGIPVIKSPLVMEGGAFETNGRGTLLQVESVTLQRNPGWTKEEIEKELFRVLGQKKIIWLKDGPADDPYRFTRITEKYIGSGTGGHIDEFARFINPTTILLGFPDSSEAEADPVKKITLARMKVNYDILRHATDQDGNPLTVIKVPVPDVPYQDFIADTSVKVTPLKLVLQSNPDIKQGDVLKWVPVSSYLNFFTTNDLVLIPQFWTPGLPTIIREEDERFLQTIEQFFPDRRIVAVNPIDLNNIGGGLHCWTQQQPK